MRESDEIMIKNMAESRRLSHASYLGFKNVLRHYTNFQGKSLLELIDEAEDEEEEKIRWKNRTIKKKTYQLHELLQRQHDHQFSKTLFENG